MENGNGNVRILVVDDDPVITHQVCSILNDENYLTQCAVDGLDGLQQWRMASSDKKPFDLLLVDLVMPRMNGHELIRAIHQLNKDVPIIVLTAHGDLDQAYSLLKDCGIYGFIGKGVFSPDQLLFSVKNALEKSFYLNGLKNLSRKLQLSKERAQTAVLAKSVFMSRISHELRTPLNAILGFGQLLKRSWRKQPQDNDDHINQIVTSGEHLLSLVGELISVANVDQERPLYLSDCSLNGIIDLSIKEYQPKAEAAGVIIDRALPDQSLCAYADNGRLMMSLCYVLDNAIKHNRHNGTVVVSCFERDDDVDIIIKDTGPGISQDNLRDIFTPFMQVNQRPNKADAGLGIGLTRCKTLVEQMNGQINVDSELGMGSTFTLSLPKAVEQNVS